MKINDIAVKYGVSKQAIYQRLKASKVKLDSIKNKENQELTPEGEALLLKWYDPKYNQVNSSQDLTVDELIKQRDQAIKDLEEARSQIAELQSRVKTAEDQAQALQQASEVLSAKLAIVPELRNRIESLEADKAFLKTQIPLRITDGTERKGFFRKLFWKENR